MRQYSDKLPACFAFLVSSDGLTSLSSWSCRHPCPQASLRCACHTHPHLSYTISSNWWREAKPRLIEINQPSTNQKNTSSRYKLHSVTEKLFIALLSFGPAYEPAPRLRVRPAQCDPPQRSYCSMIPLSSKILRICCREWLPKVISIAISLGASSSTRLFSSFLRGHIYVPPSSTNARTLHRRSFLFCWGL